MRAPRRVTIYEAMDGKPDVQKVEPRWPARLVLFAAGLGVLAFESAVTESALVQFATAGALYVFGWMLAARLAPQPADGRLDRLTWDRCAPPRVLVPAIIVFVVLGFVGLALVENFDLGPGFALWFIGFGGGELVKLVLRRQADKGALLTWKPVSPFRQALVTGPALGVAIGVTELFKGTPVRSALIAAAIVTVLATPALLVVIAISRPHRF